MWITRTRPCGSPTLCRMHWDRLFEDLEGQLTAEWEAERAVLDAESERLRIARLDLRARLRTLCSAGADVTIGLVNGRRIPVSLQTLGADWVAVSARGTGEERSAPAGFFLPSRPSPASRRITA